MSNPLEEAQSQRRRKDLLILYGQDILCTSLTFLFKGNVIYDITKDKSEYIIFN